MKVRNRILLIVVTIFIFTLLVGLIFGWNTYVLNTGIDRMRTDAGILNRIFMIRIILEETADFNEDRPKENWKLLYVEIGALLKKTHPVKELIPEKERLLSLYKNLDPLFQQMISVGDTPQDQRFRELTKKMLSNDLERMVDLAADLHDHASQEVVTVQHRALMSVVLLSLLLPGIAGLNLYLMNSSILGPLKKLVDYTRVIGSGNFSRHIDLENKDELQELGAAFNDMTTRLDGAYSSLKAEIHERERKELELIRSNKDLEYFAYIASHDLQEPLRSVAGCMQLLQKRYSGKLDPEADKLINYAIFYSKRMKMLVDDLLIYSRVTTRGKDPEPTDSGKILADVISNMKSEIKESDAEITCDPLPLVSADPYQLRQVFQTLIENAIKFKKSEPLKIHISAALEEKEWIFSVKDNGIGIDTEYFNRIFTVFQQLDKQNYTGTGMGLALARKIVERHHGRIWVESETGIGSVFYFTFPVISEENV